MESEEEEAVRIEEPLKLREAIDRVSYASSSDKTRTNLTGVFLERDGEDMLAIATDGHRLARTCVKDFPLPLPDCGLLLSATQIAALRKVLHKKQRYCEPMEVEPVGRRAFPVGLTGEVYFVRLRVRGKVLTFPNSGDFPNYKQVIPATKFDQWTESLGPKWKDMVEAAEILGDASEKGMVKLKLTRRDMVLRTERKFKNGKVDGMASVELYSHKEMGDREVLVNAGYFSDALRHVGGGKLWLKDPGKSIQPILLEGPDDLAVVMPVHI